jgi:hypothetical protein
MNRPPAGYGLRAEFHGATGFYSWNWAGFLPVASMRIPTAGTRPEAESAIKGLGSNLPCVLLVP